MPHLQWYIVILDVWWHGHGSKDMLLISKNPIACHYCMLRRSIPGVTNLRKGSIQGKDLLEISDARGGTEVTHGSLPVAADDVHNLSVINAFCLLQERENPAQLCNWCTMESWKASATGPINTSHTDHRAGSEKCGRDERWSRECVGGWHLHKSLRNSEAYWDYATWTMLCRSS